MPGMAGGGRPGTGGPSRITLLTDFGPKDPFIGIMKGVIASIAPDALVIDLCHGVSPHRIEEGAFLLVSSYRFFPPGTIHVAVVDPGVGGRRRILGIRAGGYTFLVPDNGLIGPVLAETGEPVEARTIENASYFLQPVSRTFHGRDIFAPVAAHLARGIPLAGMGAPAAPFLRLSFPSPRREGAAIVGEVIHVDHFGNLVTNVPIGEDDRVEAVEIAGRRIEGLAASYEEGRPGEPLALPGSAGYLEISVRCGRADDMLGVGRGEPVRVFGRAGGEGPERGETEQ
ncbi:MAG: SAM-dependent chlorinase/fluorinase [Planctomycetes bacterium]|nr:SAM-dependent chlorinase/fluorinase [Planctomycetota bacterium]